jgi:hypothetical protein
MSDDRVRDSDSGPAAPDAPAGAPYSSKATAGTTPRDDDNESDTLGTVQPGAGVTDVRGQPLAGSPGGGALES